MRWTCCFLSCWECSLWVSERLLRVTWWWLLINFRCGCCTIEFGWSQSHHLASFVTQVWGLGVLTGRADQHNPKPEDCWLTLRSQFCSMLASARVRNWFAITLTALIWLVYINLCLYKGLPVDFLCAKGACLLDCWLSWSCRELRSTTYHLAVQYFLWDKFLSLLETEAGAFITAFILPNPRVPRNLHRMTK